MASEPEHDTVRAAMRWILAAFYAAAGIGHLWAPDTLLAITPSWVPFPREVIIRRRGRAGYQAAALVGRRRAGGLRRLRLACKLQACAGGDRSALSRQQLALSRAAAGPSAGPDLVGVVLFRRGRLAVAPIAVAARPWQ